MKQKPAVVPGQRITVSGTSAVVCTVYPDREHRKDTIAVVYLNRDRAITEEAHWKNEQWQFVFAGAGGSYADNFERLRPYVSILRGGQGLKTPEAPKISPPRRGRPASSSRSPRSPKR
jgi:hypothetical protein